MHLRASQINGCSFCVDLHAGALEKSGETARRMLAVTAWRESPSFTDAERAALALTESATRIADGDGVPDDVWNEARKHYDERQLATLVVNIGLINFFNRLNVATRQVAGSMKFDR
jgi:AhpD family alkylhydroperoxidase